MGQDLYNQFAEARATFDEADDVLGFRLSRLCFEGPIEELTLTQNTQPALVCVAIAALRSVQAVLGESLPAPLAAAGHSLGEYAALVAAGALSLRDALRVVHLRGEAMQRAVPVGEGGMAAVLGAAAGEVEALCDEARGDGVLAPANYNCPGQIVIAGSMAALARAEELSKDKKMKVRPLKVSAPFHSPLMQPAADEVRTALSSVELAPLRFPVVANVTAQPNGDPLGAAQLLVDQCAGAVRWQQSVEWMLGAGARIALEFGSGKVLAGLNKKISKSLQTLSVGDAETVRQVADFIATPTT